MRAHVDAFHREHDYVGGQLDNALAVVGLVPHLADFAGVFHPGRVALRSFAEEVLDSFGPVEAGGVDDEHGQRLQHDVEEEPVPNALICNVRGIDALGFLVLELLEGLEEGELERIGVDVVGLDEHEHQLVGGQLAVELGPLLGVQLPVVLVDGGHGGDLGAVEGDGRQDGRRGVVKLAEHGAQGGAHQEEFVLELVGVLGLFPLGFGFRDTVIELLVDHTGSNGFAIDKQVVKRTAVGIKHLKALSVETALRELVLLASCLGRPVAELVLVVAEHKSAHFAERLLPFLEVQMLGLFAGCRAANACKQGRELEALKFKAGVGLSVGEVQIRALKPVPGANRNIVVDG